MRPTAAVINTQNLRHNFHTIKKVTNNNNVIAIIKANAYGHGIIECCKILEEEKIEFFGAAFPEEGIILREAGIKTPILVIYPCDPSQARLFCEYNLQAGISSMEFLKILSKEAVSHKIVVNTHLFIDSGLTRDGIQPHEAVKFMQEAVTVPNVKIIGICSHFATSSSDMDYAHEQLDIFKGTLNMLKEAGFTFQYIHLANSGGVFNLPEAHFNTVRPGIAMYGYLSDEFSKDAQMLKPIMSLKSKVVLTHRIEPGVSVSYERLFRAEKPTTIAIIPIGYGDGYFKSLTGKAECLINGKKYPIVGSICMDECMANIGDDKIEVGDEVILIGSDGNNTISAHTIADKIDSIPYEVLSSISARVPRIYE